ncbi:NTPase KAP family P-loop domain-containing protein 1 [Betta splendens]|uniref:NTPase KAP family P-loop domain-containing protein 1 n=1 Tax=Betta splendens TaxID=158456 RepID=A0A6P7M435_BETSP|nr:NTPase KAP family P-loop domain-containing protein 1 [Betta splendens]
MKEPTSDDIYAYALSKTLCKVPAPATVGLYSSCQNRISLILRRTRVYMNQEDGKPSFAGFLALIVRLLFYKPVRTERNLQQRQTRFIYVHFSAWHFAGSDLLWAGLVLRLFQAARVSFGRLQLVLYRVAQYDEDEEFEKQTVHDGRERWQAKKLCCFPVWFLTLCIVVIPAVVLVVLVLVLGLPAPEITPDMELIGQLGALEGLAIAAFGVPAVTALRLAFLILKNLIFNEDRNIRTEMDNPKISSQLGFMNEVRKEMNFLSRFIHFMEVFERRKIRVVLQVTNLDRCAPRKIVAVLNAINILLSDEESPFISILAVNSSVLVQKVNLADGCFSKEDRGHALLSRIVTLIFTVPPLCDESKRSLFNSLAGDSRLPEEKAVIKNKHRTVNSQNSSLVETLPESVVAIAEDNAFEMKETDALIQETAAALDVNEEEVDVLVRTIQTSSAGKLSKYMSDDALSLRRVINSIRVTVMIMKASRGRLPEPEQVAAWVVLADQWPCRLSWVLQCAEDAQQRADIDGGGGPDLDHAKTLWQVFSESRRELYIMRTHIEDLLELDGDPEMFEKFLTVDFQFTVKDLKALEMATVNLDHSMRKELALIRGTSRLRSSGWMKNAAPLPIRAIINMDTEDVCKELERMKYPSKYIDIVKSNDLNGSALVFGNVDDLKGLLGMTFGEWTTFQLHFLGLRSHQQQHYKNKPWTLSSSPKEPPRFSLQGARHY